MSDSYRAIPTAKDWSLNPNFSQAFHSALILLGTIWVVRDGSPARTLLSYDIDKLNIYPSQAVAALYKLDCGNHIVDRCRYYLEQFNDAVNPTGKTF